MSDAYRPISCDFHDALCLRAMHRGVCEIVYRDDAGRPVAVRGRIEDVYSRDREEFLRLAGGETIRLDRLIAVDGQPLPR